jgi:glycoprotein-N-acetylgalactosamine 3-beta-galactosyltransferase
MFVSIFYVRSSSIRTWAQRCDRSLFIVAGKAPFVPLNRSIYPLSIVYIADEQLEHRKHLSEKVLLALLHIHQYYGNDYDWFFKGDDDTYVIVDNLRHFLRRRSSNHSFYYGYVAKTHDRLYPSGGAGYVLSQCALKQFAEQILVDVDQRRRCRFDRAEDINLAYCLARIGIFVVNARDNEQLETFHPMTFEQHFLGKFTRWIEMNAQFPQRHADKCCSSLTISFHSLSIDELRMMDFLLYRLRKAQI